MKALTIRQPWAGAIAHQTKRVENRTWKLPAKHHGARILIHAGAEPDRAAIVYGEHLAVYSAIVAVATLTDDCHWSEDGTCCGPWGFFRSYHWPLTDVVPLAKPVLDVKGRLGIWTPDDDLVAAVNRELEASRV
jgi:hypothetical protein